MPIFDDFLWTKRSPRSKRVGPEESRAAHEGGGAPTPIGCTGHPRGRLVYFLTSTPSLLDCVCSKNDPREGFIPFGFRSIFLFCETLK